MIRNPYNRHRVQEAPEGASLTEQSHAEGSDINFIVRRFARTGQLPPPSREAIYADCTNLSGPLLERIQWAEDIISSHEAALASANTSQTSSDAPQGAITPPPATTLAPTS